MSLADELFGFLAENGFDVDSSIIQKISTEHAFYRGPCRYYLSGEFRNIESILDREFVGLHQKVLGGSRIDNNHVFFFALLARAFMTGKKDQVLQIFGMLRGIKSEDLHTLWRLGFDIIEIHNRNQWNSNGLKPLFQELTKHCRLNESVYSKLFGVNVNEVEEKVQEAPIIDLKRYSDYTWYQKIILGELFHLDQRMISAILPSPGVINIKLLEQFFSNGRIKKIKPLLNAQRAQSPRRRAQSPTRRRRSRSPGLRRNQTPYPHAFIPDAWMRVPMPAPYYPGYPHYPYPPYYRYHGYYPY